MLKTLVDRYVLVLGISDPSVDNNDSDSNYYYHYYSLILGNCLHVYCTASKAKQTKSRYILVALLKLCSLSWSHSLTTVLITIDLYTITMVKLTSLLALSTLIIA